MISCNSHRKSNNRVQNNLNDTLLNKILKDSEHPPSKDQIQFNDSINAFILRGSVIKPKLKFKLYKDNLPEISIDTIIFSPCLEYVFSPFGIIKTESNIKSSRLKKLSVLDRIDTMENGIFKFQILKYKNSKLILFFDNDPDGSRGSYIFKGTILDKEIELDFGIKIGMDKEKFINIFFDYFSPELLSKYNKIVFESCVYGLKHIYIFENNKLKFIEFKSHSFWIVDY